jgi:ATP synthase protein I
VEHDPLDSLAERIQQARKVDQRAGSSQRAGQQISQAWRISIELVAGVMVGAVLGYFLDRWLSLSPLFLFIGIMLGAVAGFRNMARSLKSPDSQ